MVKASDLQLRGRGFESRPLRFTYRLWASCSPSSKNWYRPKPRGRRCSVDAPLEYGTFALPISPLAPRLSGRLAAESDGLIDKVSYNWRGI